MKEAWLVRRVLNNIRFFWFNFIVCIRLCNSLVVLVSRLWEWRRGQKVVLLCVKPKSEIKRRRHVHLSLGFLNNYRCIKIWCCSRNTTKCSSQSIQNHDWARSKTDFRDHRILFLGRGLAGILLLLLGLLFYEVFLVVKLPSLIGIL